MSIQSGQSAGWDELLKQPAVATTPQWRVLQAYAERKPVQQNRSPCCLDLPALSVDFSRQTFDQEAWGMLLDLCPCAQLQEAKKALFAGAPFNVSEKKAALHMAVRARTGDLFMLDGYNVVDDVLAERARMIAFGEAVRSHNWCLARGHAVRDVVCLGIGGSHLGVACFFGALRDTRQFGPTVHLIDNADCAVVQSVMHACDPMRTLVVVCSKTMTTPEVLLNRMVLSNWLTENGVLDETSFVYISHNAAFLKQRAQAGAQCFYFWDWVGGRYSVWSSVGLPLVIAWGADAFLSFLDGARDLDHHFLHAPDEQNVPVCMALSGLWNVNFRHCSIAALLVYHPALANFVPYVQQLEMESNGKSCDRYGQAISWYTAPCIFGGVGTSIQHSCMQFFHQGRWPCSFDFITTKTTDSSCPQYDDFLWANLQQQATALHQGSGYRKNGWAMCIGNRPSTVYLLKSLTPYAIGQLLAAWEHKVFVQGWFWGINSFDQWGVELGKQRQEL